MTRIRPTGDATKAQILEIEKKTQELNKATDKYLAGREIEDLKAEAQSILDNARILADKIIEQANARYGDIEAGKADLEAKKAQMADESKEVKLLLKDAKSVNISASQEAAKVAAGKAKLEDENRKLENSKEYLKSQSDKLRSFINQWVREI
mgnify:FL=1